MFESDSINVFGVRERNLQNIDVSIPKKQITVFTGVSGSGKSSLVFDTIAAESQRQLNDTYTSFIRQRLPHYGQPDVDRIEHLPVSFVINQKRLGGNSRSTVGTITDIYSLLRLLYSRIGTPFAGYAESFSFNNPKGRPEVLQYELNGKNINEVLNMDIETAIHFFNDADISQVLYSLQEVGLQYITLGQSLDTLSGGELQRLKLASELTKKSNIYILDEPTTGLHISDITRLQKIFDNLVNAGNTLVVIEHNLDIIARADWVIDIGPGAGQAGGRLVFSGYPSQLLTAKESITGWHLNKYVNRGGCHA